MGEYPVWFLFQCLTASRYSLPEWCPSPVNSFQSAFPSLFYCAHWQTYVSGTLQFGYIDVTEGQLVVMGVMLISSLEDFLDIDIWMSSVSICPRFWPQQLDFFPSCISSPSTSWWPFLVLLVAFIQCSRWRHLQIAVASLKNVFQTDGTIDKIFTGGAGKAGSTVAVNLTNGYKWWRAFKTNVTGLLIS